MSFSDYFTIWFTKEKSRRDVGFDEQTRKVGKKLEKINLFENLFFGFWREFDCGKNALNIFMAFRSRFCFFASQTSLPNNDDFPNVNVQTSNRCNFGEKIVKNILKNGFYEEHIDRYDGELKNGESSFFCFKSRFSKNSGRDGWRISLFFSTLVV